MWTLRPGGDGIFDFDNMAAIKAGFLFSGNRYREFTALNYLPFIFGWMIKPLAGWMDAAHQEAFERNWSAVSANPPQMRAILGDMAYGAGRVFETFSHNRFGIVMGDDTVPNVRMPYTGQRGYDAARIAMELVWGGEAKTGRFRAFRWGKMRVTRLDVVYQALAEVRDETGTVVLTLEQVQAEFNANNPGYRYASREGEPTNIFGELTVERVRERVAGDPRFQAMWARENLRRRRAGKPEMDFPAPLEQDD